MQPSLRNLPYPHPGCPSMFKSQHGRTHHICVMHLNTHNHTINRDHWNAQENSHNDDTFGDAHFSDIENAGPLPNLNDEPGRPLPKRIEHPHLNGTITNLSIFGKFPDHLERLSALPCDLHGNGGLLEPRPPPGAIFPWLKPGQGEAQATCTNAPHETQRTNIYIKPSVTKCKTCKDEPELQKQRLPTHATSMNRKMKNITNEPQTHTRGGAGHTAKSTQR